MVSGYRYRAASVAGTMILAIFAVLLADLSVVQSALTSLPIARRLPIHMLTSDELLLAMATTVAVVIGTLVPLFKPRPRRILDTVLLVQKRVVVAGLALAAIGYFDYTYRLPRTTLTVTVAVLFVALPVWFVVIRRRPVGGERAVVVGDDPEEIHAILEATDVPVVGYVSPPSPYTSKNESETGALALADGSGRSGPVDLEYLGGLSRFDEVLVEYDIDTAILAFERADRMEFFGTLDACHEHGIQAMVPRKLAETVLTALRTNGSIVEIDLEPWDWQDRVFKRLFDVAFAGTALLALSPLVVLIATALRVEGNGPIFFSQKRTYRFGETFRIYKFRTLKPEKGGEVGTTIDDNRKTPLGNFLRKTHFDEIPQLWSILVGDMSVVGPRPAQTELEADFESKANTWKQRWFVKPGLTGLAQVNDATSQEPARKIEYDIEYIRKQSLWFDSKIVVRQFWQVFQDLAEVGGADTDEE